MDNDKKNVCVIYTGGTIGMVHSEAGLRPEPGFLSGVLRDSPVFHSEGFPRIDVIEYEPLLDSSDMAPDDWNRIAGDICTRYRDYDGFVVVHGTDTMAWTASALSFMLQHFGKPVILTGSQIPLVDEGSDAFANLSGALRLASCPEFAGVTVFFDGQLLRGNRTVKTHSRKFSAFSSPDSPALSDIRADDASPAPAADQQATVTFTPIQPVKCGVITLFPGISVEQIETMLTAMPDGAILRTFGSGNSSQSDDLMQVLRRYTLAGGILINHSQCLGGGVDVGIYAGSSALQQAGAIPAGNMTLEAAMTKLMFLLSQEGERDSVIATARDRYVLNIAGELIA